MDPLNKDCFFPPKLAGCESAARGFSASGQNGGMSHIQRVHLRVGQTYVRFCDSKRFATDPVRAAAGGWWAEYEMFLRVQALASRSPAIKAYAAKTGVSPLAYAAKLYFAIPFEWGDCEQVIFAELKQRLDAFMGRGLIAYLDDDPRKQNKLDGGAKYIPLQDPNVYQLMVPELHLYFANAFKISKQVTARSLA